MFTPKILLRGEKFIFFAQADSRPFELVWQIEFFGEVDGQKFNLFRNGKFSINGKLHDHKELPRLLTGVDCLVFTDFYELKNLKGILISIGCAPSQIVSMREFFIMPHDVFRDDYSDIQLLNLLKFSNANTLLDVNGHFVESGIFTKYAANLKEIDAVCDKIIFPIKANLYTHFYKNFSECRLKHYDAAIIYVNDPQEFEENFLKVKHCADAVITFAKYGSELEKYIAENPKNFKGVGVLKSFSGSWFICYLNTPEEDFAMYVVTHKKLSQEHVEKLPADYKIIHAGKTLSENLGYSGDDTGDNISNLNPNLNELTALYWMWKNTSHSVIGLSHYRRFFTAAEDEKDFFIFTDRNFKYEKILTKNQALKILRHFDIIVTKFAHRNTIWYEDLNDDLELANFALATVKKYLMRLYPEYEDAFDYLMNVSFFYCKNMFVARRYVFDAYCEWLFSFYIDATREVMNSTIYEKSERKTARLMGFLAERLQTVWLMKNNLRIKELYIIEN